MLPVLHLELPELRFYPAKMQRRYIQIVLLTVLRAKDSVMKTVNTVQENAGDILADAKAINEERAAKEAEEFEDVKEDAEEAEESEK